MVRKVIIGVVVLAAVSSEAAVLCQKRRSGVVVARETCRRKERPLDLAQFGAAGPQGPAGAAGPAGPPGAAAAVVTDGPASSAALTASYEPLRQLTLEAGRYVVSANVHLRNEDDTVPAAVRCRLRVDGVNAAEQVGTLAPNGEGGDNAFLPLSVAVEVAATAEFACHHLTVSTFTSTDVQAFPLPLIAVRVDELSVQ